MKLVAIESEPSTYLFPKLLITVEPNRVYGLPANTLLRAILHPTHRSRVHYENFYNTFFWGQNSIRDLSKGTGQWGSVQVYRSEYGDITYSVVRFCYQPIRIRLQSWKIARREQERGAICEE